MKMVKFAVFAVVFAVLVSSSVFAATWNGLTVDSPQYTLNLSELGSGWGYIQQFNGTDMTHSIAVPVSSGVGYSLPQFTAVRTGTPPSPVGGVDLNFWGVCIDTHEWSENPQDAYLEQGWATTHTALGTSGRLNGTVLDSSTWKRTTYLFSKFGAGIGDMSNVQKAAFQLATWEVMSGDGSASGGVWDSGNFTATGVAAQGLDVQANAYVAVAYNSGFDNWTDALANQSFYFSGVNSSQDYLVYAAPTRNDSPPVPPVPEIPAMMLCPIGFAAIGLIRRKLSKH